MKKCNIAVVFLVLAASLSASPILFEATQQGKIEVPAPQDLFDTTVVELNFSLDQDCYAMFVVSGFGRSAKCWLTLDGDTFTPPTLFGISAVLWVDPIAINRVGLVNSGNHTVSFHFETFYNTSGSAVCDSVLVQALVFLPDSGGAVAEQSAVEPGVRTASVISQGPYVSAPGASELVDSSGRIIENAIQDGRVQIYSLPPGTYFAKSEERTVVKIVKVE